MVAGLATVFVDRHKEGSSHAGRSDRVGRAQQRPPGMNKGTLVGLAALDPPAWYSGPVVETCQCWPDQVNSGSTEMLSQSSIEVMR